VAENGIGGVLRMPEFYPWLLVAVCGMIFQQSAFRAGALTASLPTMTVAKPAVAGVLGITVLGETLETKGPGAFVLVAAVAVVIIATVALARGEAASMAAGTGQDLKLRRSAARTFARRRFRARRRPRCGGCPGRRVPSRRGRGIPTGWGRFLAGVGGKPDNYVVRSGSGSGPGPVRPL